MSAHPSSAAVERVLAALPDAKRRGAGWIARCPAHDDGTPSLSLDVGDDGRALVLCRAGCTLEAILAALGLAPSDLFANEAPRRNGHPGPPPRREQRPARDWKRLAIEAHRDATREVLEGLARALGVRADVLPMLRVGWLGASACASLGAPGWDGAWCAPERDGAGAVVGLALRSRRAEKRSAAGAKRGLTVPADLAERPGPVLVVEGLSDVGAALSLGLAAVGRPSNASGAEHLAELLAERAVLVLGERDGKPDGAWPGRDGAVRVATALARAWERPVRWALPPAPAKDLRAWLVARVAEGLDLEDPAACAAAGAELLLELERTAETIEPPRLALAAADRSTRATRSPVVRSFAEIPRRRMEWLWPGRLPLGKLVLLAGDPGGGKSTLTLDLAAHVSNGKPWPDGAACARGAVLLLSAEDDPADTTGPRLDAAGADGRLVHELSIVTVHDGCGGERTEPVTLADLREAEGLLRAGVALPSGERVPFLLVVVDPLTAYLAGTDTHRNADVRVALRPLQELAERVGVAMLAVLHPRKGTGGSPLDLISGSRAFVEAARAAWLVTADPDDEGGETRLFLPLKANVLPQGTKGLRFTLEHLPDLDAVRVRWLPGDVDARVRDVLAAAGQDPEERSALEDAKEYLREALADGERYSLEVEAEAKAQGIAERTLTRAKEALRVRSRREGKRWHWSLPDSQGRQGGQERQGGEPGTLGTLGALGDPEGDDDDAEEVL